MKKISTKIKFIGLIMGVATLAVIGTTILLNSENKKDATVINIAGKQRMLTQKITRHVYSIHMRDDRGFHELDQATDEFRKNLQNLMQGNLSEGIYPPPTVKIKTQLEKIEAEWKRFATTIERFKSLKNQMNESLRFFTDKNDDLLKLSNRVVKSMVDANYRPELIDKSGAQRMLSQRMASQLLFFITHGDRSYLDAFHEAYREYEKSLEFFYASESNIEHTDVKQTVLLNRELWISYRDSIEAMLQVLGDLDEAYQFIREHSTPLLQEADMAVTLYSLHSEERREFLQNFQITSGIIVLFLIIYIMMMAQGIKDHMEEFLAKSRRLAEMEIDLHHDQGALKNVSMEMHAEAELQEASGHINAFIYKINECAKKSVQAQELSERIAEELAAITDELAEQLEQLDIEPEEKKKIAKEISKSEDMAIQSSEEIISAIKLLKNLQSQLDQLKNLHEKEA